MIDFKYIESLYYNYYDFIYINIILKLIKYNIQLLYL